MRALLCASFLLALSLAACDETATTAATDASSRRIEAGLVGNWAKPTAVFSSDTLVFTETKYRTPYLSGTGSLFSAKDGLVKGGPGMATVGEYRRSGDSLWFDGLLGSAPDGIVRSESNLYLRVK